MQSQKPIKPVIFAGKSTRKSSKAGANCGDLKQTRFFTLLGLHSLKNTRKTRKTKKGPLNALPKQGNLYQISFEGVRIMSVNSEFNRCFTSENRVIDNRCVQNTGKGIASLITDTLNRGF